MIPVPLPPLAEQERIITDVEARLSVIEALDAMVSSNRIRADRLRQSILQQAFNGNLNKDASH
jgi:type I restriction enzyme S subunit